MRRVRHCGRRDRGTCWFQHDVGVGEQLIAARAVNVLVGRVQCERGRRVQRYAR